MARTSGLVQKVGVKTKTNAGKTMRSPLYSLCIDDVWYGFGFDNPNVEEGQVVSFDWEEGKFGKDGDAGSVTIEKAGSPAAKQATAKVDARQESIVYQSQHRDAIEAVKFMVEQGAVKLPAKQADKYDVFLGLVHDLTVKWTNEALNPVLEEVEDSDPIEDEVDPYDE